MNNSVTLSFFTKWQICISEKINVKAREVCKIAKNSGGKKMHLRRCIQKFPDWVDNNICAYNSKHSLRCNTKGYGGNNHRTDSQNTDTTARSGRELYHLQFSLQAAIPETFGYTLAVYFPLSTRCLSRCCWMLYTESCSLCYRVLYGNKIKDLPAGIFHGLSSLQLL
jgi:hypothetical protein